MTKENLPTAFKTEVVPEGMLVHAGRFSPDGTEYYFTVSDPSFERFDVKMLKIGPSENAEPEDAFFNSRFSEHGICFSPDGKSLFFSSTRPVGEEGFAATWHIWKSEKKAGKWSEPEIVRIPGLEGKLTSHPSLALSGNLYFHASEPDYSEMTIYYAIPGKDGSFGEAKKIKFLPDNQSIKCTPFVASDESYLIYGAASDRINLTICFPDSDGNWSNSRVLSEEINEAGQGNPWVSPDGKWLFFSRGSEPKEGEKPDWKVMRVSAENLIKP